ncbi:MAG: flagellar motor switch protein FliN [Spirochaetia bacterium]
MSDGSLSQDEIDALLQGSGDVDFGETPSAEGGAGLGSQEIRAFSKLMDETLDSQASIFSMLLSKTVTVRDPKVNTRSLQDIAGNLGNMAVQVTVGLNGAVSGPHAFFVQGEAAQKIAGPMMGEEQLELDDAAVNALQEAFSQITGNIATTLGNKTGGTIMTDPAEGTLVESGDLSFSEDNPVTVSYELGIEGEGNYTIYEVFSPDTVQAILEAAGLGSSPAPQAAAGGGGGNPFAAGGQSQGGFGGGGGGMNPFSTGPGEPDVQAVQFPGLQQQNVPSEQGNIGLLMDVSMEMTVELGRTKWLIRDILGMAEGTIVQLDKLSGEPVDILVNNKPIAKGEVVVIDENFGVRVTEIVSGMDRLGNLK